MEKTHKAHTLQQIRQSSKNRKIRKKIERRNRGKKRKIDEIGDGEPKEAQEQLAMPSEATRCVEAQKPSLTPGNAKNLVAEKQRFYRHAVYFHSMWKKSEKPKELSEHMVKRGEKFSSGTFGVCFSGTFGSLKVCIKDFDTSLKNEGKHEAKIFQNLRHPNLPLFIGVLESASSYSVVTKFHEVSGASVSLAQACANDSDLRSTVRNSKVLVSLFVDLANALHYIHESENMLHNDVKGNNVVLESEAVGHLKAILIDFGKACEISKAKKYRQKCDRQRYPHLAPEFAEGGEQSKASDIFSFGFTFRVASHKLGSVIGRTIYKQCLSFQPQARPDIEAIKAKLESVL